MNALQPVTFIGDQEPGGLYLLRILVSKDVFVHFGRYQKGEPVRVPAGGCVYVGSAQGQYGSATVANRLIRHATRSGCNTPHLIRTLLVERFQSKGMGGVIPKKKSLHWHVDYLLDLSETEIGNVIVLYGEVIDETRLADIVRDLPDTFLLAPGLGAGDDPGSTHLLTFRGGEVWWCKLVSILQAEAV
jgi:Uri superfamily endonuclease